MKTAVMQPYFFPYIGYWQLINAVDIFVIFDDVNFIKKGFVNRNNILINGEKKYITLQLKGASQNKCINEITVGDNVEKILKTIYMTYRKAPYFHEIYHLLEKVLQYQEKNLASFLGNSIMIISDYLSINTKFIFSSTLEKNNVLKGQDKIIDICKQLGTDCYINSIGGQALYDKKDFKKNNIILNFLKSYPAIYKQFNYEFVSSLSIIDIMMFNSRYQIKKMLNNYELH